LGDRRLLRGHRHRSRRWVHARGARVGLRRSMPTRRLRAAVFAATARRHATRLGAATALVGHL